MKQHASLASRPLWQVRWAARVTKAAVGAVVAILSIAGLLSAFGSQPKLQAVSAAPTQDLSVQSLAERFVRAYLTWDPSLPEQRERRVSVLVSEALEPGAGLSVIGRKTQAVVWTAVVQDRVVSRGRHLVTVAAETTGGPYYLSVPVDRDRRGFMSVSGYPALVGAPAVDLRAAYREEPDVEDPQLEAVTHRVVTNYLAREAADLRADLDTDVVLALPSKRLKLTSVDAITWAGPRRIGVELLAEGAGAAWSLRYELDVVKRDRWYVRSIQTNPNERSS